MPKHTFSTIMLLAEGTEEGMQAARSAIELAADEEAALVVVSVVDTATLRQLLTSRIFVEEEMNEYEKELEVSCRMQLGYTVSLAERQNIKTRAVLQKGACHTIVLQEQRTHGADLLVMGAFRTSMIKTDLMAREKQLIIEDVSCPVLLVPAVGRR